MTDADLINVFKVSWMVAYCIVCYFLISDFGRKERKNAIAEYELLYDKGKRVSKAQKRPEFAFLFNSRHMMKEKQRTRL